MERFIRVEIFRKKSNAFRGIPFSPFLLKRPQFVVYHLFGSLVPGFMPRKSENFAGILSTVQLNPVPVFGAKKIPVPFDGNTWVNFCWVCATRLSEPLPNYRLFCAQRLTPS